jgi:hypothetical protein
MGWRSERELNKGFKSASREALTTDGAPLVGVASSIMLYFLRAAAVRLAVAEATAAVSGSALATGLAWGDVGWADTGVEAVDMEVSLCISVPLNRTLYGFGGLGLGLDGRDGGSWD